MLDTTDIGSQLLPHKHRAPDEEQPQTWPAQVISGIAFFRSGKCIGKIWLYLQIGYRLTETPQGSRKMPKNKCGITMPMNEPHVTCYSSGIPKLECAAVFSLVYYLFYSHG